VAGRVSFEFFKFISSLLKYNIIKMMEVPEETSAFPLFSRGLHQVHTCSSKTKQLIRTVGNFK
jgi:hypothetical protein